MFRSRDRCSEERGLKRFNRSWTTSKSIRCKSSTSTKTVIAINMSGLRPMRSWWGFILSSTISFLNIFQPRSNQIPKDQTKRRNPAWNRRSSIWILRILNRKLRWTTSHKRMLRGDKKPEMNTTRASSNNSTPSPNLWSKTTRSKKLKMGTPTWEKARAKSRKENNQTPLLGRPILWNSGSSRTRLSWIWVLYLRASKASKWLAIRRNSR